MKSLLGTFVLIITIAFAFNSSIIAQDDEDAAHYYTITTWKIMTPAGGSNAEFMGLMNEWKEKVVLKNDKILSSKVFTHRSGADMRDWVFIDEYASWCDIEAANDVQNKLVAEGWPDEEGRKKFFDTFFKYVVTHSDEIVQEVPGLVK